MYNLEKKDGWSKEYAGLPIKVFRATAALPGDDESINHGALLDFPLKIDFDVAMHPNASHRVMVMLPGLDGEMDGYMDKYMKIACFVQNAKTAAVVRSSNHWTPGLKEEHSFRFAMEHLDSNSYSICGEINPETYLMGYACGAGIMAAYAHEYPNVKKILLVNPTGEIGEKLIKDGLSEFTGEVTIVAGELNHDSLKFGKLLFDKHSVKSKAKKFLIIPNCDHALTGKVNGMIYSKLPFVAFDNSSPHSKNFPSTEGGLELY